MSRPERNYGVFKSSFDWFSICLKNTRHRSSRFARLFRENERCTIEFLSTEVTSVFYSFLFYRHREGSAFLNKYSLSSNNVFLQRENYKEVLGVRISNRRFGVKSLENCTNGFCGAFSVKCVIFGSVTSRLTSLLTVKSFACIRFRVTDPYAQLLQSVPLSRYIA